MTKLRIDAQEILQGADEYRGRGRSIADPPKLYAYIILRLENGEEIAGQFLGYEDDGGTWVLQVDAGKDFIRADMIHRWFPAEGID